MASTFSASISLDHGAGQHLLFLAGADEQDVAEAAWVRVEPDLPRLDPPEQERSWAAAWGEGTGFQLGFQLLNGQVEGAGKAINLQVFKPMASSVSRLSGGHCTE